MSTQQDIHPDQHDIERAEGEGMILREPIRGDNLEARRWQQLEELCEAIVRVRS